MWISKLYWFLHYHCFNHEVFYVIEFDHQYLVIQNLYRQNSLLESEDTSVFAMTIAIASFTEISYEIFEEKEMFSVRKIK